MFSSVTSIMILNIYDIKNGYLNQTHSCISVFEIPTKHAGIIFIYTFYFKKTNFKYIIYEYIWRFYFIL